MSAGGSDDGWIVQKRFGGEKGCMNTPQGFHRKRHLAVFGKKEISQKKFNL